MLEGSGRKSRWISGAPPLSFRAKKAGTLENYRIYGNTVGGESVGDLVESGEHAGEYEVSVTVSNGTDTQIVPIYLTEQIRKVGDEAEYIDYGEQKQHRVRKNLLPNADWVEGYITGAGGIAQPSPSNQEITSPFVKVIPGKTYVFSYYPNEGEPWRAVIYYTEDKRFIKRQSTAYSASSVAFTVESGVGYVRFSYRSYGDGTFSQLELGDTATDYEPYIENTDLDVTLPALPTVTGTNVLSVGTAVQPSKIEVKGKIKAI